MKVKRLIGLGALAIGGSSLLILPVMLLLGTSNESDGFKTFLGVNQDELVARGNLAYPQEDARHNHQCHRLAARLTTERYGPLFTLAGGIANEVIEAMGQASVGANPFSAKNVEETLGDLGANWRGIVDGIQGQRRQLVGW